MKVRSSATIHHPPETVFAVVADVEHQSRWVRVSLETRITSRGPFGVGSRMWHTGLFLGRRVETTDEVTVFEPNRCLAYRTVQGSGPLAFELRYDLEPVPEGTRLTISSQAEVGGFFRLAGPALSAATRRHFEATLENLERLLERAPQTVEVKT